MMVIYFFISLALAARAGLFYLYWRKYHRRESDIHYAIVFILLAASYALYGVEHAWEPAVVIEWVLDVGVCGVVVYTFIRTSLKEIRRMEGAAPGKGK